MKTSNLCVCANTNYDSKTKLLFEELEVWKSVEEGTGRLLGRGVDKTMFSHKALRVFFI